MKTKSIIGKTIMARERGRSRNLGVIQDIDNTIVKVHSKENPEGYKDYELNRSDFDKWVEKKLYRLR